MSTRSAARDGIPDPNRIRLLEDDIDHIHDKLRELKEELKAGFEQCEADSAANRKILTGLLVSVVGSTFGIVGTIIVTRGLG